jgi:hypothetical protein
MRKSIRNHVINFTLLFCSILVALAIFELGLRITGFTYPGFYTTDRYTGIKHRPNVRSWHQQEGGAYVAINSDGLRDREHPEQKPENTLRIAVLGDSYTAALQVAVDMAFWSILEHRLNACGPFGTKKIEVINFGVGGYGTAQELLTLQHRVWKYSPDIVLLAFFSGNDIRNNSKALHPNKTISNMSPFFTYENGNLTLDNSFLNNPVYIKRSSRSWQFFQLTTDYLRSLQFFFKLRDQLAQRDLESTPDAHGNSPTDPSLDRELYMPPSTVQWREAWKVTEALIARMRDEVERHGAKFIVVTLSNGIQVHPDREVRQQFMRNKGINNLFYPDDRIREFGIREGIEVISLAPLLQEYVEENTLFLHGFRNRDLGSGHWNEDGHRVAGEEIARYFCAGTIKMHTKGLSVTDPS